MNRFPIKALFARDADEKQQTKLNLFTTRNQEVNNLFLYIIILDGRAISNTHGKLEFSLSVVDFCDSDYRPFFYLPPIDSTLGHCTLQSSLFLLPLFIRLCLCPCVSANIILPSQSVAFLIGCPILYAFK